MHRISNDQSWLKIKHGGVTVDCETYIRQQPVSYAQVREVIEHIRERGDPVHARIDVTGLRISRVDITGVIRIIWELHKETEDENLLSSIELVGASPRVLYIWNSMKTLLPEWIRFIE